MRPATWGQSPKGWTCLGADVCWEDHGGTWCKRDKYSASKRAYYLLRFENMKEHGIDDMPQYEASSAWVDLADKTETDINSALSCIGAKLLPDGTVDDNGRIVAAGRDADLVMLYAFAAYGLDWDHEYSDKQPRNLRARVARSC